jgi:very-short-patch-repair endonuclease
VHRVHALPPVDTFTAGPFRVTTIPRTFVDLADVMSWAEYRALADAQRHLHVDRIREAQARAGRRVGRGLVTRLVEADDAHTKSEFERRFLRFLAAQRIAAPSGLNVPVAGHKADCHYAVERLVVELDGRGFHARRAAMRADRHRDTDYQLAGHRILRLVWDDLHPDEGARTADRLRRMLVAGAA